MSKVEIRHEQDHYTMYISGEFAGNYDSVSEAAQAYENERSELNERNDQNPKHS